MENLQLSLFGKMYPEHTAATGVMISGAYCKKSQRPKFQCLNAESGQNAEWLELTELESLGELSTPSIGAFPNVENVSTLSQILQPYAPKKYSLSPRACSGIKNRTDRRGKKLEPLLDIVLTVQGFCPETVQKQEA